MDTQTSLSARQVQTLLAGNPDRLHQLGTAV